MTTQDDSPRVADNAAHPPDPKTGRTPCEPHEAFTLEPAPRDARDETRWQALLWGPDGDDSFPTWEAAAEATHALVTSVELASARPDDEPTWLARAVEMADRLSKGEDLGQASSAGMLWEIIDWYRRHTTSASARPQAATAADDVNAREAAAEVWRSEVTKNTVTREHYDAGWRAGLAHGRARPQGGGVGPSDYELDAECTCFEPADAADVDCPVHGTAKHPSGAYKVTLNAEWSPPVGGAWTEGELLQAKWQGWNEAFLAIERDYADSKVGLPRRVARVRREREPSALNLANAVPRLSRPPVGGEPGLREIVDALRRAGYQNDTEPESTADLVEWLENAPNESLTPEPASLPEGARELARALLAGDTPVSVARVFDLCRAVLARAEGGSDE